MELRLAFGKGEALTFDGICNDNGRHTFYGIGFIDGVDYLRNIVPVDFYDVPAERRKFPRYGRHRKDGANGIGRLHIVFVNKETEIVEFVICSAHRRFPNLPFGKFAVTAHAKYFRAAFIEFKRGSDPGRNA